MTVTRVPVGTRWRCTGCCADMDDPRAECECNACNCTCHLPAHLIGEDTPIFCKHCAHRFAA